MHSTTSAPFAAAARAIFAQATSIALQLEFYKGHSQRHLPAIDPTKANHEGRTVFITGASGGIGLATAISFARAGASQIALSSIEHFPQNIKESLQEAAKAANRELPTILTLYLDVLDATSISNAVSTITETSGNLDILVNNAGYMSLPSCIAASGEDTYWKTFEINFKGTYRVTKAFLPLLLSTPDGLKTIVNLNSVAAHTVLSGT